MHFFSIPHILGLLLINLILGLVVGLCIIMDKSGEIEISRYFNAYVGFLDKASGFDNCDSLSQACLVCLMILTLPYVLVSYILCVLVRTFYRVFLRFPWKVVSNLWNSLDIG